MTCGFSQAGVKILGGIDIEKKFQETYLANNPSSKFICEDITHYEPKKLEQDLNLKRFDDNLIFIGCSPCQYWSKINTVRRHSVQSSNLLIDFQRFINYFKPGFVIVENVPGLLKAKNNHVLLDFLDFLNFNGYCYEHRIVQTNQYGVPQKRKRFVLIASRTAEKIDFPKPTQDPSLTVKNFIGEHNGFPQIPAGYKDGTNFMHTTSSLSELNLRRLEKTKTDGGTREGWKDDDELQIPAYKGVGKDKDFKTVYGRMHWNQPSPTITTRFIAISCGRFAHPEENRGLSLREGATLQTFPKDFMFTGGLVSVAKQIGNAVPPEMAKRIAISIINHTNDDIQSKGESS